MTLARLALADWLTEASMTHGALASTGAYGPPVSKRLEGPLTVFWGHAAPVQNVPGRKTEKAEARWLATRRRFGWLPASCIPPQGHRAVRDVPRYRPQLVPERVREVKRLQSVLERANITLASVASDLLGVSGRARLEALLAGKADPATRADLATRRRRATLPLRAPALPGGVRDHHRPL